MDMVGVGYRDIQYVPNNCNWSQRFDPGVWECRRVCVGEECQDGLTVQEECLVL